MPEQQLRLSRKQFLGVSLILLIVGAAAGAFVGYLVSPMFASKIHIDKQCLFVGLTCGLLIAAVGLVILERRLFGKRPASPRTRRESKDLLKMVPELAALPRNERLAIQQEALRLTGRNRKYVVLSFIQAIGVGIAALAIIIGCSMAFYALFGLVCENERADSATRAFNTVSDKHPELKLGRLPDPGPQKYREYLRWWTSFPAIAVAVFAYIWPLLLLIRLDSLRRAMYAAPYVRQLLAEKKS